MNKPLSPDEQVRVMINELQAARARVPGRSNIGLHWLARRFQPSPRVFWKLVDKLTDFR